MLLSPGSAEKVSKIRVKNREPVPSYRMDRNDDEIDAMMCRCDFTRISRLVFDLHVWTPLCHEMNIKAAHLNFRPDVVSLLVGEKILRVYFEPAGMHVCALGHRRRFIYCPSSPANSTTGHKALKRCQTRFPSRVNNGGMDGMTTTHKQIESDETCQPRMAERARDRFVTRGVMSDGEGDSSDNLDRDDSSDDGDLDDGVGNDHQLKRQDGGDMEQEMQVHQALLRQAEAAAHMQNLMQSQLGLSIGSGFPNLSNFPGLPGMAGLGGLHPDLQAQLQAHIQALSGQGGGGGGGGQQGTGNGTSNGHGSSSGNESQSPPAGMGPPKTSSPLSGLNNASQNSLLSLANSSHHSLTTPASSPYNNKQRHHSNAAISPRRGGNGQHHHHHHSKDSKDDLDQDSMDGSSSPSPPASMLASIAAAASALRSPSGGLLPPSSAASHHPYLASAFSNALGGLSALTSGLSVGGSNGGAHGSAHGGQHPPLTPSPSSDSPQQTDAPRGAPNSSQQSWTFEEQFKQGVGEGGVCPSSFTKSRLSREN
ncbi:hypothetical protein DAPPUDRAFT_248641 [Daphnia pulex]|uniref:Uncharacterized protein n=1 Tax=Daphnia pulex TaxID=6669 RepID=E9GUX3_DAPPU|nr:hypothetical protein DAPPUDRAFT_248641 [Daphnia pulex]|eukprot:EFX76715.1 hypothetical protein DAPPUDRAFT_248641 [Daphnia pulex]